MTDKFTVLPLVRAMRDAQARGVTTAQMATMIAMVGAGYFDALIDTFEEAEAVAARSGLPIRSAFAIVAKDRGLKVTVRPNEPLKPGTVN
jgi:hypothetical protein